MRVVLVRPRDPNNVGACARAMANFGVADLVVVAPHPPVWSEVRSAVGASEVLASARVVATMAEAIADRTWVGGTTTARRRIASASGEALAPDEFFGRVETSGDFAAAALVFGNEKSGLAREELARCHAVVTIRTERAQPSLNLAHAVVVCCYEASRRRAALLGATPRSEGDAATTDRAVSVERLDQTLARVRETRGATGVRADRVERVLRNLLLRARAREHEVELVEGLLTRRGGRE